MKAIKMSPDDVIMLWENMEKHIPVDSQETAAKEFIDKLVELKADYTFLDMIRNYNNNLDYYLEVKMLEMDSVKKSKASYYEDDEPEDFDDEYDY